MIERSIFVKRTAGAALSLVLAAGCIPLPAANVLADSYVASVGDSHSPMEGRAELYFADDIK